MAQSARRTADEWSSPHEFAVLDALGTFVAQTLLAVLFVFAVGPLEPIGLAVSFEGQNAKEAKT